MQLNILESIQHSYHGNYTGLFITSSLSWNNAGDFPEWYVFEYITHNLEENVVGWNSWNTCLGFRNSIYIN